MQRKEIPFTKKLFILFLPLLFIYGCGVWTNFTTYFNLYYDTKDLFSQAESDIKAQNTDVFDTGDLVIPSADGQILQKVIEKCSNILQFHAQSSYVDDALLIVGKSFYYQANYLKAVRKFNELLSTQPNSDLILEASLWTGKSKMKLGEYDSALTLLQSVIKDAQKSGDKNFVVDAYLEQIKYRIIKKDIPGAITLLNDFMLVSNDDKINAQAEFELGSLYEQESDLQNAIQSYKKVETYSPPYKIGLNALLELGRIYRKNKQYQDALNVFDDMRSKAKYSEANDSIEVERGITLSRMGRYEDAVKQLISVDTAFARTPSAGFADYELAKIFQNHYNLLDSAGVYYNKSLTTALPLNLMKDAKNMVDLLNQYKSVVAQLGESQKKILYVEDPEAFVKDSVAYQEEVAKQRRAMEDSLRNLQEDSVNNYRQYIKRRDSLLSVASRDRFIVKDSAATKKFSVEDSLRNLAKAASLVHKSPPVRPTQPLDTLKMDLVKYEFTLGNLLFTEFNMPDSAYGFYMNILENYPGTKYQANVLFALGSYYLTKNDSVKADSLFNIIYNNYKNQSIVNAAADKLKKPLINLNYDPAEPLYSEAADLLGKNKYDSSLVNFYNIFKNHPKSPFAAKALYASGWVLENKLNLLDSAAAVYDTLSKAYPKSIYASAVYSKLAIYMDNRIKQQQLKTDSLKIKNGIMPNGLASDTSKTKAAALEETSNKNKEVADNKLQQGIQQQKIVANPDSLIRVRRRIRK